MTYSIVARDPVTGQLGVGVQTAYFAVGSIVPWLRPGVGAVATQAIAEPAYGPRCLDALEAGATAVEALAAVRDLDPMAEVRQVGVIGIDGEAASMTGDLCVAHAGHVVADGMAVQGNMLASVEVWPAASAAFASAGGPLAHRLLAGLRAAQAAGGDARGAMSAAIVVVDGHRPVAPGHGTVVDVRVDHSDAPLEDLARLLVTSDAYASSDGALDRLMAGDAQAALAQVDEALRLVPTDENLQLVRIGALAAVGRSEEALTVARALVARRPSWATTIASFAELGLLPLPPGTTVDDLGPAPEVR